MQKSDEDCDSKILNRMVEEEHVKAVEHVNSRKATVLDKENPGVAIQIRLLIGPGVHKTLLSEKD